VVSIAVEIGEGALPEFEEPQLEEDAGDEAPDDLGASTLERIRLLELKKRETVLQQDLDELEARHERRRGSLADNIRQAVSSEGSVVKALVPVITVVAEHWMRREPSSATATKAVVEMVSEQAKAMSGLTVAAMKEIMSMNMEMVAKVQDTVLDRGDPMKEFLGQALTALPLAFGKTGSTPQAAPPGVAGPPAAGGSPAGGATAQAPGSQAGAPNFATQFSEILCLCLNERPDVRVMYEQQLKMRFGLMPDDLRQQLLAWIAEHGGVAAIATFVHNASPAHFERFKSVCESEPRAQAWVNDLASLIEEDFAPQEEPSGVVEGQSDGEFETDES
jgi:hypothetical protein